MIGNDRSFGEWDLVEESIRKDARSTNRGAL